MSRPTRGVRVDDIPWSETFPPWPEGPPLADLFGPREARAQALRFHVVDRLEGEAKRAATVLLRRLSPERVSAIGGRLGATVSVRRYRGKVMWQRMASQIARLSPDHAGPKNAARREAMVARWFENCGRAFAEAAIARAMMDEAFEVKGLERLADARGSGRPLILVTVHTGSWEAACGLAAIRHGAPLMGSWQPQTNRFQNRLIASLRRRDGYKGLAPSPHLARTLLRAIREPGQNLLLLIDEISERQTKFPLFGRPLPERCNFTFALKVAQREGALIVPFLTAREPGSVHQTMVYEDAIPVAPTGAAGLLEAAAKVNAVFEPHVRARLDEWYMLHNIRA